MVAWSRAKFWPLCRMPRDWGFPYIWGQDGPQSRGRGKEGFIYSLTTSLICYALWSTRRDLLHASGWTFIASTKSLELVASYSFFSKFCFFPPHYFKSLFSHVCIHPMPIKGKWESLENKQTNWRLLLSVLFCLLHKSESSSPTTPFELGLYFLHTQFNGGWTTVSGRDFYFF